MKSAAFFGAFLFLTLTNLSSSFGRHHEDDVYPSFSNPRFSQYSILAPKLSSIEATLGELQEGGSELKEAFKTLSASLTTLVGQFTVFLKNLNHNRSATCLPPPSKCPTSAPNGTLQVGSKCFFVNNTADTFSNASASCRLRGAILAEPLFSERQYFFSSLNASFPNITNLVGNNSEYWIGLIQPASTSPRKTPFAYQSDPSLVLLSNSSNLSSLSTVSKVQNAVVFIAPPGTEKWKFYDVTTSKTGPVRRFICQYNATEF